MQPAQLLLRASPGLQQWRHPGTDQPSAIGELNVYYCLTPSIISVGLSNASSIIQGQGRAMRKLLWSTPSELFLIKDSRLAHTNSLR